MGLGFDKYDYAPLPQEPAILPRPSRKILRNNRTFRSCYSSTLLYRTPPSPHKGILLHSPLPSLLSRGPSYELFYQIIISVNVK